MKRNIITISNSGTVNVTKNENIRMTITEIANLLGVFSQTAKSAVRSVEKSDVAGGDYSMSCTVDGTKIYPDYYGLELIIAVAFRVKSGNAEILRNWVIKKVARQDITEVLLLPLQKAMLN